VAGNAAGETGCRRGRTNQHKQLVHREGPFRGRLLFPYGWGAVFSGFAANDMAGLGFFSLLPAHQVLLRDDLDE
jgi:hypothetical protein